MKIKDGYHRKRICASVLLQSLCLATGILIMIPVFYCLALSFMKPTEILSSPPKLFPGSLYLENYISALRLTKIPTFIKNSLIISLACSTGRVIVASLAAYAFAFYEFKGKKLLFYLVLGTMLIPADATIVTNYMTVSKMGLVNTYAGIMILYFVSAANIFLMRQHFLGVSKELKDASMIDGCGSFRFYLNILMPVAKPIIASVFIAAFVSTWNMYLWPMIITTRTEMRTVQVGISMLNFSEEAAYGATMAGAIIVLIPSLLVFLLFQKRIVRGMTAGSVKG